MNAPANIGPPIVERGLAPVPSLERRRLRGYLGLLLGDVVILMLGFFAAGAVYAGRVPDPQAMRQAFLLLPIFLTLALHRGVYSLGALTDWRFAARRALGALIISAALLSFVAFYLKTSATFSRGSFTIGLVLGGIGLTVFRRLAISFMQSRWNGVLRNRLLILDGAARPPIPANWVIDATIADLDPDATDPHGRDRLGQALYNQDEVIVCCAPERRASWAWALKASGTHGEILSATSHALGALQVKRYEEAGTTALVVSAGPLGIRARAAKRLFDLAVASAALLILAPVMLIVAALIRIEDGGPALFVQQRTGRGNRLFSMLKFRSMRAADADTIGAVSTARDDARITRIGRFIRRTSIDELPQLLNVLRGEMSIVGPRPHAPGSRAGDKSFWEVDTRYWHRHALKPGLTGLAQVRGLRGATALESDLADRLQADLEYLAGWSMLGDIGIVLRTLRVLHHDRAF